MGRQGMTSLHSSSLQCSENFIYTPLSLSWVKLLYVKLFYTESLEDN